jgi:hypothetical protein
MRTRKLPLIVACFLVASLLAIWVGSRVGARTLTLMIVDQGLDKNGQRSVLLLITNVGPFRICYPDGFEVQPKGAATPAYVRTTNLWLDPGEDAVIPVVLPVITTEWCGVANYYTESPWNRSKIWLSGSSIGQRLPSAFTSVRGGESRSPWMPQSPPSGPTRLLQ